MNQTFCEAARFNSSIALTISPGSEKFYSFENPGLNPDFAQFANSENRSRTSPFGNNFSKWLHRLIEEIKGVLTSIVKEKRKRDEERTRPFLKNL
jgi:hypothetical protein